MGHETYVHGYSAREAERLADQATTLAGLLHHDTLFPPGSLVLEAGCGTGAQTVFIAPQNPESRFMAIDISQDSLNQARRRCAKQNISNVEFRGGDIFKLDFPSGYFDHVLICFVLEHLPDPVKALLTLVKVLKTGGTITVIEGDHGSVYFYPESREANLAIQAQVTLQAAAGGNANIGRRLYPLLTAAGLADCRVSPRLVYADASRPSIVQGFTLNTFTAMIEGVREQAIGSNIMDAVPFDQGITDLKKTAGKQGVFCYTFFKGVGRKIP